MKYRRAEKVEGREQKGDVLLQELGVTFGEVVSLLGRLLGRMAEVEQDFEYSDTLQLLDKAGRWIECIPFQIFLFSSSLCFCLLFPFISFVFTY